MDHIKVVCIMYWYNIWSEDDITLVAGGGNENAFSQL